MQRVYDPPPDGVSHAASSNLDKTDQNPNQNKKYFNNPRVKLFDSSGFGSTGQGHQ